VASPGKANSKHNRPPDWSYHGHLQRIRDHEERAGRQAAEEARPAWRGLLDALDEQIQAATTIQV
jgi:hypothetical protein